MTTPLLKIGKTNTRRTLKEKLTFYLLEEKLIFSLNFSLSSNKAKGKERERLWDDFLRKHWALFYNMKSKS